MMSPSPSSSERALILLWHATLWLQGGMLLVMTLSKLSLDPASAARIYAISALPALLVVVARWRGMPQVARACETIAAGLLATVPLVTFSYAAIGMAMPLADQQLIAMDRALGFDWMAFVTWIDRLPALPLVLELAYSSFAFQLLGLPVWLSLRGKAERGAAMVFAYILLCTSASVIAMFFPSVGAYVAYGMRSRDVTAIDPFYGFMFLEQFHALRDEPSFTLHLDRIAGILTFPSVHVGVAVLCAWAGWGCTLLRWPMLALNALMALSAISHGGHYLVDVLGGAILAGSLIALLRPAFGIAGHHTPRHALALAQLPGVLASAK